VSGDRFRQGHRYLGTRHHRLHQRTQRRRGARAADCVQLPVPAVRPSLIRGTARSESMAKKNSVEKNNKRRKMAKKLASRRAQLKGIAEDNKQAMEERVAATLRLTALRRKWRRTRIRNRCELSGRPRAYYRKHRLSRIALRELGSKGLIPGLVKSSW